MSGLATRSWLAGVGDTFDETVHNLGNRMSHKPVCFIDFRGVTTFKAPQLYQRPINASEDDVGNVRRRVPAIIEHDAPRDSLITDLGHAEPRVAVRLAITC